jgi:long-chain fatty acid transport protein
MKCVSWQSVSAPSLHDNSRRRVRRTTILCRALSVAVLVCIVLLVSVSGAQAQGIFLTGIGPVNTSMGGAAVAAPLDSAGALFWNSATTSGLKQSEMEMGIGFVLPTTTLSSTAGPLSGSTQGEPGVTPIPTMAFVSKNDCSPWSWGVGIFGVGGFSANYPASTFPTGNPILFPQTAGGIGRIFSDAEIYQLVPSVAYQLTDKLSIGFGADIDLADIQADPLIFAPPNGGLYGPGTGTRYAWGGGFQAGLYYTTDYCWNFGVSFKSAQWFEPLRFNSNDALGNPVFDKVNFQLPSITSIGASYTGFDRWLYAVDVRWFDYEDASGFNGNGFKANGAVSGLGWHDIVSVASGVQYCLTDCCKLRLGYTYVENPVPSSQTFFNLGTALIMSHFVSVGASYMIHGNVEANISYTHGFEASQSGPIISPLIGPAPGTSVTNKISADEVILGLTVYF